MREKKKRKTNISRDLWPDISQLVINSRDDKDLLERGTYQRNYWRGEVIKSRKQN